MELMDAYEPMVLPDPDRIHTRAEFAEQLTLVRDLAGISIRDLATSTDIRPSTVGGYFSGRHLPSSGQSAGLVRILEVCGVKDPALVDRWLAAAGRARRAPGPRPASAPVPFRGLESYQVDDRDWFFGRDGLTRSLTARVLDPAENGILFVIGASGSGKSSLLRAGLLATIADEAPTVATVLVTPGQAPLSALVNGLATVTATDAGRWAERLADDPGHLDDLLPGAQADRPVLVLDQFEELFAEGITAVDREAFLAALTATAATVRVVLGMRADFYAQAACRPELVEPLQRAQIVVGPLSEAQLREVITEPARRAQADVEDGLVDLILRDLAPAGPRDLAYEAGTLPLLSHVLLTAWQRGQRRRLTIADYQNSGGLYGAVAQSADQVYDALSPSQQRLARRLFVQLVHTSDGMAETRRRVAIDDLRTGVEADDTARDGVLHRFIGSRLVTGDVDGVQITHEALVQAWPRLREWIDADRAELRLYHRLRDAARVWDDSGRAADGLLRGAQLELTREWAANPARAADLNLVERAYLDGSIERDVAERQVARRRGRLLVRLLAAATALLLVSIGSTGFALVQRAHAVEQQRIANDVRDVAVSRQVAGDANRLRDTDPALAGQLALAAYRISPTPEARSSLYAATAGPAVVRFRASAGTVAAAASPGGDLLATGDNLGAVRLWHLDPAGAPTAAGAPFAALNGSVFAAAISADGHLLAIGGKSDQVTLWDIAAPSQPRRIASIPVAAMAAYGVALSADGRTLAIGTARQGLRLWDVSTPTSPIELTDPPADPTGDIHTVAFTADDRLVIGTPDFTVRIWRAGNPRQLVLDGPDRTGPTGVINAVAVDPRSGALAAASTDRTVYLWRSGSPGPPVTLGGFTSFANAVAFSPDGLQLAAGGADGIALVWAVGDLRPGQRLPHPGPVTGLIFLPGGALLTASADGYARVWALPGAVIRAATNQVFTVAFSQTGRLEINAEATAAAAGGVSLWDVITPGRPRVLGPPVPSPDRGGRFSGSSAISPSGGLLAVGAVDGTTALWDVSDPGTPRALGPPLQGSPDQVEAVAFSADNRLLAVGGDDHHVWLWDVSQPSAARLLARLDQPTNLVLNLAFSPTGGLLAAASADRKVYLWDVRHPGTPQLESATTVSGTYVYAVAFSPDGGLLAVGSADKTVRLFDVHDAARPRVTGPSLTGPTNYVYAVAFSPDGLTLAAGSTDHTVRLWTLPAGGSPQFSGTLTASGAVFTIAFSPDGRVLAAGTSDNSVWLWRITADGARAAVCRAGSEPVTVQEWQQYVPGSAYRLPCDP